MIRQDQTPTQGILTYPESTTTDNIRSNVLGSPQRRADLPPQSSLEIGSGEKRSPQQDAEIRQIMSRGYSYELAAEIYFKMKSRSTLQSSSEKVKN